MALNGKLHFLLHLHLLIFFYSRFYPKQLKKEKFNNRLILMRQ